jgi:tetratricopeptide (TPR) repeat protein
MTQRDRLSTARIRPPYVEGVDAELHDDLHALPRPVPRAFLRLVIAASLVTIVVAAILALRQQSRAKTEHSENREAEGAAPHVAAIPAPTSPLPVAPAEPAPTAAASPGAGGAVSTLAASTSASSEPAEAPVPAASSASASAGTPAEPSEGPSPRVLVARAQQLLARGSYSHAIDLARRATQADPSNSEGWLTLGGAYQASGSNGQARAAYKKCVQVARGSGVAECRALLAE